MANPIKPTIKTEFIPLLLIILTAAASVFFYNNLPERIATHWNFAGQVDAYGSGKAQAVALPSMIIGMYLLFLVFPYLDPKKERYEQFSKVYHIFKAIILGLLVIVYFIVGLNGLGYNLPVGVIIPFLIGLLFIIIGNYMAKIKMNWFMGIRTPWTLSSEEIWNKTHRFGGKIFVLAGLLMMAETILPLSWKLPVFVFMIAALLFGTIGYSYIIFLLEKKKKKFN
ncbi:MAG: SdpI family protein [Patescibacteria group bacterium]|nr:SdpI family protein [Patescibacteria group bacterium]